MNRRPVSAGAIGGPVAALALALWLGGCVSSRFVENAEGDVFPPPFCEFDVSFPEVPRYSLERLDGEFYPRGTIETELYLLRAECAPRVNPATTAEILAQGYATQYPDAAVETVETAAGPAWRVTGSLQVGESTVRDEYHIVQGETSIMVVQTAGTEPRYPVRQVRNFIASLRHVGDEAPEFAEVDVAEAGDGAPVPAPPLPSAQPTSDEAAEWSGPAPQPVLPTAPPGLVVRPLDEAAEDVPAADGEDAALPPGAAAPTATSPAEPAASTRMRAAPLPQPGGAAGHVSASRPQPLGPAEWAAQAPESAPAAAPPAPSPAPPVPALSLPAASLPGAPPAAPAVGVGSAAPAPVPVRAAEPPADAVAAAPTMRMPAPLPGLPGPAGRVPASPPASPPGGSAAPASPVVPEATAATAAPSEPSDCIWSGRSGDARTPNLEVAPGRLVFLGDGSRPSGTLTGARAALLLVGDQSHLLSIRQDGIAYGTADAAEAALAGLRSGQGLAIRVTGHQVSDVYRFDPGSVVATGAGCGAAGTADQDG